MSIQLVTDQLSTELDDTFKSQLVGNFKKIEEAANAFKKWQIELQSEWKKYKQDMDKDIDTRFGNLNQDLNKELDDKLEGQNESIQEIINILAKYDVPIQIVDGKVVEITEEGD